MPAPSTSALKPPCPCLGRLMRCSSQVKVTVNKCVDAAPPTSIPKLTCPCHLTCCSSQVKVIINDRVDVAIAAGADGVHVGQDDMPCQAVRSLVGPDMIIGVSCKTPEQARAAAAAGADYLGVGAGVGFSLGLGSSVVPGALMMCWPGVGAALCGHGQGYHTWWQGEAAGASWLQSHTRHVCQQLIVS